jgi:hypothetical protein
MPLDGHPNTTQNYSGYKKPTFTKTFYKIENKLNTEHENQAYHKKKVK